MVYRELGQKYLMPLLHGVFLDVSLWGRLGRRRGGNVRILRNRPGWINRENSSFR